MEFLVLGGLGTTIALIFIMSHLRRQRKREDRLDREALLSKVETSLTTMPCPKCAEDIKIQAKVCRFCGHDVTDLAKKLAKERAAAIAEHRVVVEREKQAGNRKVGITFLILGIIAFGVGLLTGFWLLTIVGVVFIPLALFALWGAQTATKRAGRDK